VLLLLAFLALPFFGLSALFLPGFRALALRLPLAGFLALFGVLRERAQWVFFLRFPLLFLMVCVMPAVTNEGTPKFPGCFDYSSFAAISIG
jgi:hypothetical protein